MTYQRRPCLVLFSGLPGTGKTTLAEYAADVTGYPLFTKDLLEATLWRSGIGTDQNSGWAGYELIFTITEEMLRQRQSIIIDTVAAYEPLRRRWFDLADRHQATIRVVECICSDEATHRARLERRVRNIPGWYEVTWEFVERQRQRFDPWTTDRLILDALDPLAENEQKLLAFMHG